jgi:lysine-specific demethylase/histidyl-hydroxylase NO66
MTEADALNTILGPLTLADFLAIAWEKDACHIPRNDPGRFKGLVSLDDIERGLMTGNFNHVTFRLSREGTVPKDKYKVTRRYSPETFVPDEFDVERIMDEFACGASFVMTFSETKFAPISALTSALSPVFNCRVEGHVIVTPQSKDRALERHADTVDVFALQVSGRKRWKVYSPQLELPLYNQRNVGLAKVSDEHLLMDVVLNPGDTLYVPRGFYHAAEQVDGVSIHVAVGVRPYTIRDAILQAVEDALAQLVCADDPRFRRSLIAPACPVVDGSEQAIAATKAGIDALFEHIDPARGVAKLGEDLRRSQYCMTSGRLAALACLQAMTAESRVALGYRPALRDAKGPGGQPALQLEANNHTLQLPEKFGGALRQLLESSQPIPVGELVDLDREDQLILGKLLVRMGVGVWLDPPQL